jgi:[acyl-carrier-protein] S-malonyltransferase
VGVLSNYTGGLHDAEPASIRTRLFFQLFNPVNWVGCLGTAIAQQVTTFVEFGGGLGAEEGPAAKRPNLESIIRKTLKVSGVEARHVAAINCETLRAAAAAFAG